VGLAVRDEERHRGAEQWREPVQRDLDREVQHVVGLGDRGEGLRGQPPAGSVRPLVDHAIAIARACAAIVVAYHRKIDQELATLRAMTLGATYSHKLPALAENMTTRTYPNIMKAAPSVAQIFKFA
jgi:hypothetical protein